MARHRKPPSQRWKTFLRNHAGGIAAIDLFVVPTLSFRLLYGLLILWRGRRQSAVRHIDGFEPPRINPGTTRQLLQ